MTGPPAGAGSRVPARRTPPLGQNPDSDLAASGLNLPRPGPTASLGPQAARGSAVQRSAPDRVPSGCRAHPRCRSSRRGPIPAPRGGMLEKLAAFVMGITILPARRVDTSVRIRLPREPPRRSRCESVRSCSCCLFCCWSRSQLRPLATAVPASARGDRPPTKRRPGPRIRRDIRFDFACNGGSCVCGQYANGDYWVVDQGLVISRITPDHTSGCMTGGTCRKRLRDQPEQQQKGRLRQPDSILRSHASRLAALLGQRGRLHRQEHELGEQRPARQAAESRGALGGRLGSLEPPPTCSARRTSGPNAPQRSG